MQSSCAHDAPNYTAQALRAREKRTVVLPSAFGLLASVSVQALRAREKRAVVLPHAFGLLAIVAGWTWCAPTRGGRGVRDARTIVSALHVS
jgi:hypothetical protein